MENITDYGLTNCAVTNMVLDQVKLNVNNTQIQSASMIEGFNSALDVRI